MDIPIHLTHLFHNYPAKDIYLLVLSFS